MKVGSRARMWEQLEPTGPVWVGFQPQRGDGEEVVSFSTFLPGFSQNSGLLGRCS